MNILFMGDIMGKTGRKIIKERLPELIEDNKVDFVIANGENSAGGLGITKKVYDELISYGIDIITLGNHAWSKKEVIDFIDEADSLIRPANYPTGAPGKPYIIFNKSGVNYCVINICGRVFMECLDCPFLVADKIVSEIEDKADVIIVDFHGEATSEKVAMGWFLDGRVTAVLGTHTHVQTADERILPMGTAYITDAGMTGPRNSVLGVKKEIVIKKFLTGMPGKFELEVDSGQINGVIIDIDSSFKPRKIKRLNII